MLAASPEVVERSLGNSAVAALISSASDAVREGLREDLRRDRFHAGCPYVHRYLVSLFQGEREEHLHCIFLDAASGYLGDERVASGYWSGIDVKVSRLFRRGLEFGAAGIVLAHNHPSGLARASAADVRFTSEATRVARALDIELIDHLIVAGPAVYSMRGGGQMP